MSKPSSYISVPNGSLEFDGAVEGKSAQLASKGGSLPRRLSTNFDMRTNADSEEELVDPEEELTEDGEETEDEEPLAADYAESCEIDERRVTFHSVNRPTPITPESFESIFRSCTNNGTLIHQIKPNPIEDYCCRRKNSLKFILFKDLGPWEKS